MVQQKRPRHDYSLADKVWLLDHADKNPALNAIDLGKALAAHTNSERSQDEAQVPPPGKTTVNDWRKSGQRLRQQLQQAVGGSDKAKRHRMPLFPELEQSLALWFRQQEAQKRPVTDELLRGHAKIFGSHLDLPDSFSYSDGWLGNFKKRHGIKQVSQHGKADAAGLQASRKAVQLIIKDGGYAAEDIYNQDESWQLWRQVPQHAPATGQGADIKKDKQRIMVSLCCNAAGTDKRALFVVGKAKRPRSFPKNFQPERDWGVRYCNNAKAWMMPSDFSSWVKEWNGELAGTVREIVLIVDSAPVHTVQGVTPDEEHGLKVASLSNIKVVFLPANIASKAHPLAHGITAAYKAHFRQFLVQWLLEAAAKPGNEAKQLQALAPNKYQAMYLSRRAWKDEVAAETIRGCWRKSGLLPEPLPPAPEARSGADSTARVSAASPAGARAVKRNPRAGVDVVLQGLAGAIAQLEGLAVQRGLLPEGEELTSAKVFVELEGDDEVFDELSEREIAALVQSQGGDVTDSDEDEQDGGEGCTMTVQEALACAQQLESFAFSNPELLGAVQLQALSNIKRVLQGPSGAGMQQQTLAQAWAGL